MRHYLLKHTVVLAAALLAGCASTTRDAGFGDVSKMVAERTGQKVHWDQGTPADADTQAAVGQLLQQELTPDTAVQVALLNNADLQAVYEELGVAQAQLVRAGLLRNPIFDAEAKFVEGGGGTIIELAVAADFLDLLQVPLRRRLAAAELEAAKLRVAGEAIDSAGRVRAAFYSLQAAQETLGLRRTVVAATEASYDFAKRLGESGNLTELDEQNERALYEQSKLDLAAAETDVLALRERLNVLLGVSGEQTQWTVASRLPELPAEEPDLQAVERRAVEQSLELASARLAARNAARTLGLNRSFALLPELEAGAAAEREADGEWAVGPAIALPIPLFDMGQASIASARAELRRREKALVATAVRVRSAARAARDRLVAARDRAAYYRQVMIPLRMSITHHTQLQYNAMEATPFQLLQAKRDEIEAGAASIEALRDYWLARTALEQIQSGRMSEDATNVTSTGSAGQAPAGSNRGGH